MHKMRSFRWLFGLGLCCLILALAGKVSIQAQTLGPVDQQNLPATDLERVQVQGAAPDFILTDVNGHKVQLSKVAKTAPVVLVFYRGHW